MGLKSTEVTVTMRCRVAVCGDSAVGKSALVSMFSSEGQRYPKEYQMTTGVSVVVVPVQVPNTTAQVELYSYDTAGNGMSMLAGTDPSRDPWAAYWPSVYYAILVYDVSSPDSFESCKVWLEELKKTRPDKERPLKAVLVAAKADLPSQRHLVAPEVAAAWANSAGLEFFQVSSEPPGKDIDAPFLAIAKSFHKTYEEKVAAFQDTCRNY